MTQAMTYQAIAIISLVTSLLTSQASLVCLGKFLICFFVRERSWPGVRCLALSISVLSTASSSPEESLIAAMFVGGTPYLLGCEGERSVNVVVMEVFAVYIGCRMNRREDWGSYVLFFALVGFLACYLAFSEHSVQKGTRLLHDSTEQLHALQSSVVSLSSKRHPASSSSPHLTSNRITILNSKLKSLASPKSPMKRRSFSDYCGPYLGSGQKSDGEESKHDTELSMEEMGTVMTTILSNEFLLYGSSYPAKPEPTTDVLLNALLQKEKITLRNGAKPFKSKKRSRRLRSMMEENSELNELFEHLGEWNFNVFSLLDHTQSPLREVAYFIFSSLSLPQKFSITRESLLEFLDRVESGYKVENFYHNSLHAADVLNSVYYLLYSGVQACGDFAELEVFTLVTAALAHDVGHPGFNNAFLVLTRDALAKTYNDQSVLENMHASTLFAILRTKNSNITRSLPRDDFFIFRKLAISLILATDLQRHFEIQAEFRNALEANKGLDDVEFRLMTLEICAKIADIGHGAKERYLHRQWSVLITKEFFRQGDMERCLGLPVSPLFDRSTLSIPKSQIGFIEVFVRPLFDLWADLIRRSVSEDESLVVEECFIWIADNLDFWEQEMTKGGFQVDDLPPLQILKTLYRK